MKIFVINSDTVRHIYVHNYSKALTTILKYYLFIIEHEMFTFTQHKSRYIVGALSQTIDEEEDGKHRPRR